MRVILIFVMGSLSALGQSGRFASAGTCATCHSNMLAPSGAADVSRIWTPPRMRATARPAEGSIAPFALWPGSMMAHASRDPYWKAKLRFETAQTPAAREVIEDKCMSCHAPHQQYELRAGAVKAKLDDLNAFGEEGVACTVCHQITDRGLGTKPSFTAGFEINDRRIIFGPHADPFAMPMFANTGYTPAAGRHILEASLCGSCHTVITPTLTADGTAVGEFVEQAPYLEWLRSAYPAEGATCQSCHIPTLKDEQGREVAQYIAHNPGGNRFGPTAPRVPFGLHFLSGGNLQVLGMLKELYPEEANVLELSMQRTRQSLNRSVALRVTPRLSGNTLEADVEVVNRTGHKLPTAYPSRRLWLHVTVTDRKGAIVFDSGGVDPRTGEIRGLGEGSQTAFEPHQNLITRPDQAAVYEAEMRDPAGSHTLSLLRGAGFIKDNRILPRGYDAGKPLPEGVDPAGTAPVGVDGDSDFRPGSDTVRYRIDVAAGSAPFRVAVEALYQSVKPSHLGGMEAARSREEDAFLKLFPRHKSPVLAARQEMAVGR